ncbi:MAG: hypothetical protein PHW89_08590 [Sulfurimonas denitrificans]|nr:hypothetical protein [Sulfurimonas denitrificans]
MRVGFLGGMANNLYIMAKAFNKEAIDINFIRDISDIYPISQPVWQDMSLTFNVKELSASHIEWWYDFEKKVQWVKPDFVYEPKKREEDLFGFKLFKFLLNKSKLPYYNDTLYQLKQNDVNIVCGLIPTILAYIAKKPYVIWPHGSDMRMASNVENPYPKGFTNKIKHFIFSSIATKAFQNTLFIANHDPTLGCSKSGDCIKAMKNKKVLRVGIPTVIYPELTVNKKKELLINTLAKLGIKNISNYSKIIFIPSRIDFKWKKSNLILEAISEVQKKTNICFIVSGWGANLNQINDFNLDLDKTIFLKEILSKPLLTDLIRSVDLVVDHIYVKTYGTLTIETMGCRVPVVMSLEKELFNKVGWSNPPHINAKCTEDLINIFIDLDSDNIDLDSIITKQLEWLKSVHSDKIVINSMMQGIKNFIY